jgi:ketosteroid isomerase-like protein
MPIDLPKPIADFVAANARRDLDGMVRPFTPDAVILDNGKRVDRQASMRALFEHEVVPVKAIFTPETIRHEAGWVVVEGPAHSAFPGSPLRFPIVSCSRITP